MTALKNNDEIFTIVAVDTSEAEQWDQPSYISLSSKKISAVNNPPRRNPLAQPRSREGIVQRRQGRSFLPIKALRDGFISVTRGTASDYARLENEIATQQNDNLHTHSGSACISPYHTVGRRFTALPKEPVDDRSPFCKSIRSLFSAHIALLIRPIGSLA